MGIFCSTYDTEDTVDTVDTEDIQLKKAIEESLWSEHVREHDERQLKLILKVSEVTASGKNPEEKYHSDDGVDGVDYRDYESDDDVDDWDYESYESDEY
tara:strand:+ start:366 stop:662 length:297 start_codon:yes stop_codon:yes gene_type:complete